MLLPHGYDGAGPEHSSGRVERFLEMCDDDMDNIPEFQEEFFNKNAKNANWAICNCTTSANYYHLLRRQMHRDFRKPVILMAPKKLLKHRDASCNIEAFGKGLKFNRTIGERNTDLVNNPDNVKRIIFCSGQVYYDIAKERDTRNDRGTVIITVEQLFPLPYDHISRYLQAYPNAKDIVWCQEEPKNYGAYSFIKPRLLSLFKKLGVDKNLNLRYSGREPNSSPATGYSKVHATQQKNLVDGAFDDKH
jgi:2-oxoglutarate dehydrogenase E1 component